MVWLIHKITESDCRSTFFAVFLSNLKELSYLPWPNKYSNLKTICHFLWTKLLAEAATRGVLQQKLFLEMSQNSQENTCARVSFLIQLQACNFIKKETLAQVISCEFCKFSKNTSFREHLRTTVSLRNISYLPLRLQDKYFILLKWMWVKCGYYLVLYINQKQMSYIWMKKIKIKGIGEGNFYLEPSSW